MTYGNWLENVNRQPHYCLMYYYTKLFIVISEDTPCIYLKLKFNVKPHTALYWQQPQISHEYLLSSLCQEAVLSDWPIISNLLVQAYLLLFCFTVLKYHMFCKLKILVTLCHSSLLGPFFLTTYIYFMSLCNTSVILSKFQGFNYYVCYGDLYSNLCCHYFCFRDLQIASK